MKSWALLETEINSQYSKRFEKFGPTAKGVFWASTARQEKRFDLILEEIQKISATKIRKELDWSPTKSFKNTLLDLISYKVMN